MDIRLTVLGLLMALAMMLCPMALAQPDKAEAARPVIEALDETPLASRIPLLLVHGIDPSRGVHDNWDLYLDAFEKAPGFDERYKIYLYHYDPKLGAAENTQLLEEKLKAFVAENSLDKLRMIVHSLGGVLVKNLAGSPVMTTHVDRVITISTPFHGTPLTSKPWIMRQFLPASPMRLTYQLGYRMAKQKFPTYRADYCWDNFDWSMPEKVRAKIEKENTDCVTPPYDPEANQKTHWITYASFFTDNDEAQAWLARELDVPHDVMEQLALCKTQAAGLFGKRRMLVVAREKIAKLDLNKSYGRNDAHTAMFFNDGVAPITSNLWLGRFGKEVLNSSNLAPEEAQLAAMKSLKQNPLVTARLFAGLDHRDWMEGTSRYTLGRSHSKDNRLRQFNDLLHPEEEARTTFDWVIDDLMRETQAAAR